MHWLKNKASTKLNKTTKYLFQRITDDQTLLKTKLKMLGFVKKTEKISRDNPKTANALVQNKVSTK